MSLMCPGTPTDVRPSYRAGFAPRNGLPQYPRLWRGLVGLWAPYLGPTGLSLYNWSPYRQSLKGTLTNMDPATDYVMSPYGPVLDFFTAADQKVLLPTFSLTTNWSIALWVWGGIQTPVTAQGSMVFGKDDDDNFVYMQDGTRLRFENAANANVSWATDTDFYHRWRHVVLVADATGITLYLDGISQGRQVIAPSFELEVLGLAHTTASYDFLGRLGSFSLHSRTLLLAEAQHLYRDPHALTRLKRLIFPAAAAPPPGAIMNLMQGANLGADLYNGTLAV